MHAPLSIKNLNRLAVLLTSLLVAYTAATVWNSWSDEKAEALKDMATIMEMEARAFDNYFTHLELALKDLGDDLSSAGERIDLDRAYILVRKFRDRHPELYNVTLIQADGEILLTARNPPRSVHATLAGEASFIHFLDAVGRGELFAIGRPLLGKLSKTVIVPVRYAIKDRQGKLGYVVSANLPHEHLQAYWIDSPLTTRAAIGLIRDSGFLLSRYPVPANLTLDQIYGVPRTGALIHHLQQQGFPERGYVEGPSSLDGPDFLTAFRRLPTHPLTLFIAMPLAEIRAAWWRRVSGTCFALLLLFGGGIIVYRDALRRQRDWDIDDQRRKEAQRQNERRLGAIIEALPVPTAISDAQHHVTYVNAAFTTAFGYQQRELPDLAEWWVRACPDTPYRQGIMDTWYARLAGLQSHAAPLEPLEVEVTTKSGERRTVLATASLLALPDNRSHLTTWYDITERKRTEAQLESLVREQRAILNSPVVGIVKVRARVSVWANAAFARMLGYSPEELIGQPTRIAYPNDEAYEAFGRTAYPILARGEVYRTEMQLRHKDGTLGWYEIGAGRLDTENAEILGAFVDITRRKAVELALRTSEERLRSIFQSMAEGLTLQSRDGSIIDANPAAEALLGLDREQLLGKTSGDPRWCAIREDGTPFPGVEHPGMVTLRTGKSSRNQIMGIRAPGNGLRWISINTQPVFADDQGLPEQVIATFVDVTERRQAEAAVLATKIQMQAILDAIPDVLLEVGVDGCIHSFHAHRSDLLAVSPNLAVGKTLSTALPAEAAEACIGAIREAVDQGWSTGRTYRLSLPPGERWFELSVAPVAAATGQAQRVILLSRDITERKRLETELVRSAREIEDLYDNAPCGYHSVGPDGLYLQINATELAWLGYRRDEVVGRMAPTDFFTPTGRDQFEQMFPRLKNEGRVANLEFELVARNGPSRQVSVSATSVSDADGRFLMSRSVMFDITEIKALQSRMQQLLTEQQALLQQLEAQRWHLQNIVDGTRAGTWEWNIQTGECVANELLAQMAGYTLQELAPLSIRTWARLIHPDDRELSVRLLDRYFSGELPYYEYEGRVHHKDGHWVWVLVRGKVSQWSDDGRPLLLSGTHQDISAQKRNVAMLDAARLQAEAASLAKSRFLATMSHEIRTPMHAILGMAQMLRLPGLNDSRRQDYARIVLNSGQALLALLNDILDLSKIEAGGIELESVALRPREILDDTQILFAEAIHQKGLHFESEWSGPAAQRYLGDPYRLRQMLANLLGNAVKFTEQGRIRLAARELERDATTAVLEFAVSDTGIGIPQDKQQGLFLPFAQADTSITRQYGGTGLGLSIVSSLANRMHGEVGVESAVGRGSRFWFRLRAGLVAAGGNGPEVNRPEPSAPAAGPAQLRGRVLVVDDSRSSRKVIEAMLDALGLSVDMAENGQQAVDACLRGDAADLMLMDLHMPVMDGYDAAVRIRRWEVENAQPRHPIIALTADVKDDNRQLCLAVDMDGFLCKPLVIDALAATLGRYLPLAATPAQVPAPGTIDPQRVTALLGELEALLAEGRFDAVSRFRSLQEAVAGTELVAELAETGRLLAEVRFDLALDELRRVVAAQGWRNKG